MKKAIKLSKKKLIITASVAVASTIGLLLTWWFYWPIHITENRVKASLNDPDSAKFKGIEFSRETRTGCGFVNAKNKMGGYVGSTMFIAKEDGSILFAPPDEDPTSSAQHRLDAVAKTIAFLEQAVKECPKSSEANTGKQ